MPAERLRSEAPDLTSRPAAATPSTPDTPATEPQVDLVGIESETDPLRVRWRVLRYGLQEYRRLKVKNALGPREGSLLCDSVSGILEASGRGEQADWNRSSTASQYYMVNNGRGYAWDVGEFPEYDAWREYWRTMAKYNEAPTNPKIPREPAPAFDSANFELFESRALEAIALLETRISGSSRPK